MATILKYDTIAEALYSIGYDETCIRADYSGRFMYGDQCFGLVVPDIAVAFELAATLAEAGEDISWIGGARTDSMARDIIIYWPHVQLDERAVLDPGGK